jgi:RNA polymerase sporulation-specific sigma factor
MTGGARMQSLLLKAKEGNQDAEEQLLKENNGLIWSIVRRYSGRGVELDDLYQLGSLGFLKAVRGFDPAYGTQFSTYAVPKIAGEIRRFLRDDGPIKVSRSLKELSVTAYNARERLSHTLGRAPTLSELSKETGYSPEEIAAAELAACTPASLQAETGEHGATLQDFLGGGDMEETILEQVTLQNAIAALPDAEKQVIFLRFFKGLTQVRSAQVMGISQVQVSRLERRAISKLRETLLQTM